MKTATSIQALALTLLLLPVLAAGQTTWFVSNDPSENPDFPSIAAAVASPNVLVGDTLLVSEGIGPYTGGVFIDRYLHLIAESGEQPTMTVGGPGLTPKYCIRTPDNGPGVHVVGFKFLGPADYTNSVYEQGMHDRSRFSEIEHCLFTGFDSAYTGLSEVRDCQFINNRYGWPAPRSLVHQL